LELAFIEVLPSSTTNKVKEEIPETAAKMEKVPSRQTLPVAESIQDNYYTPVANSEPAKVKEQEQTNTDPESSVEAAKVNGISLSDVTGIWPKLRESVGKRDKNLQALLASSKPLAFEENVLILGFDYQILKDKFDGKSQASENIADSLSTLLGTKCTVRTVVTENYATSIDETAVKREDFEALANELGGVVSGGDN
jgi:hypothetical protein